MPFSALVAWEALTRGCGLMPFNCQNRSVFLVDGTSDVGCPALQLLRAWGAARIVVCAPYRCVPLAKMLGAGRVIAAVPDHLDTESNCSAELTSVPPFDAALMASSGSEEESLLSRDTCNKHVKPGT